MCTNFPASTQLGNEVVTILDNYLVKNLRPRFNPRKLKFDLTTYLKHFPEPCLAKELDMIFCGQFERHPLTREFKIPGAFRDPKSKEPIAKLTVITDELMATPAYFEEISRNKEFYKLDEIISEFKSVDFDWLILILII